MSIYSHFIRDTFRRLLPPTCILCGYVTQQLSNLCAPCQQRLPILPHHCPQCAQFLPFCEHPTPCGTCLRKPPPFERTFALFPYEFPITKWIIQLKFGHQLSHAKALGNLMSKQIQEVWYAQKNLPDAIIPVPLHHTRIRERGFNQALEIAKPIAKALSIPLDIQGAERIKATVAQSGLQATERAKNMADAFMITRNYSGQSIAVIDDVMTTGHTLFAFCKKLKEHGAKHIDVWCAARRG